MKNISLNRLVNLHLHLYIKGQMNTSRMVKNLIIKLVSSLPHIMYNKCPVSCHFVIVLAAV